MNEDNNQETPSDFPVKRKRGRPRKYPGLTEVEKARIRRNLSLKRRENSLTSAEHGTTATKNKAENEMVGQPVQGVVEATFDDGYLLSVRVGNSEATLRGVVFKPGHYIPVSADNDVAPTVQMIKRNNISIPREKLKTASWSKDYTNGNTNTNPELTSVLALSAQSEVARAKSVPEVLRPTNLSIPSVVTKTEASGSSNGYQVPAIKPFGELLNEIMMKRAQTQSQQEQVETQTEDQALSPEPLQAVHPSHASSIIKPPVENFRTGNMTDLLQAVQDNTRGMHTPPAAEAAPGSRTSADLT